MTRRTFTPGASTFPCQCCKRMTRMTTQSEGDHRFCGECEELLMMQNTLWDDGHWDWMIPARDKLAAKITKRGGDLAAVKVYIPALFALEPSTVKHHCPA